MTILSLIIVGCLWVALLVPPLLRARSDRKSGAIGDYAHTLGVLKTSNRNIRSMPRTAAGFVNASMHRTAESKTTVTKKRRRDVFTGLLTASGFTFVIALFSGSALFWTLHILVDLALGTYVFLLLQIKEQSNRIMK